MTEVLLSHMLTFFNDKRNWSLRFAFFESIVVSKTRLPEAEQPCIRLLTRVNSLWYQGVASYVGSKALERFILPLIEKCIVDTEEFVVEQTINALTSCMELGLFEPSLVRRLTQDIGPLLVHPRSGSS